MSEEKMSIENMVDDKHHLKTGKTARGLPVDKGWAWAVLVGALLAMVIIIGIMKSTGILFVALQDRFESNSAMTSLISTVQNGTYSFCALFVTTVGLRLMSCRAAVLIGSVISCVAHIVTAYAETVEAVMFSMGVLHGIGLAFMMPSCTLMIGRYFERRRGFANSLAISGGGMGGLIFAPLLTVLFKAYSFSGTFLLIGGFYLNVCVSALLFRPFSFYEANSDMLVETDESVEKLLPQKVSSSNHLKATESPNIFKKQFGRLNVSQSSSLTNINMAKQLLKVENGENSKSLSDLEQGQAFLLTSNHDLVPYRRPRTYTNASARSFMGDVLKTFSNSNSAMYASSECITPVVLKTEQAKAGDIKDDRNACAKAFSSLASVFDFSLFKNTLFILIVISTSLLCPSSLLLGMYLAPYVKEMGVSANNIALLLTIIAVIDFFSRICVGLIADRGWCRRSTIIGLACTVMGIAANLLRFFQGFAGFVAFSVLIGLLAGVFFSLFAVVLVDYLTIERMQNSLGFTTLFNGISIASTFAINGYIRDYTGTYIASFHFMGVELIVGGILMLSLPYVERCIHRKDQATFPEKTHSNI